MFNYKAKKMYKYYLLGFLFIPLLLLSCHNNKTDTFASMMWIYLEIRGPHCTSTSTTEAKAVDNHNGTMTYTETTTQYDSSCVSTVWKNTDQYKKCLQGQVYRTAEDDCKGTGDNTNFYGAQKFQYCATDRELDCILVNSYGSKVPDPVTSPAYASCYNDGFAGIQWSLPNAMNKHGENGIINAVYSNRPDEIQIGSEQYWGWLPFFYTITLKGGAKSYRIDFNSVSQLDSLRTDNHFVICSSY
jgi:hypothetical protein